MTKYAIATVITIVFITIAVFFSQEDKTVTQTLLVDFFLLLAVATISYPLSCGVGKWNNIHYRASHNMPQNADELHELGELYWTGVLFVLWAVSFKVGLSLFDKWFGIVLASVVAFAFAVLLYNFGRTILILRGVYHNLQTDHSNQEGEHDEATN